MKLFGCEIVEVPNMPRTELLLVPSRLPGPMSRDEAIRWLLAHSVRIVDPEDPLTTGVSSKP